MGRAARRPDRGRGADRLFRHLSAPYGRWKGPRNGATVFQQPDAVPEISPDGVKGAVTQAYYTNDGHMAIRLSLSNGMGAAQQMRSIEIKVANGDGVPIAA